MTSNKYRVRIPSTGSSCQNTYFCFPGKKEDRPYSKGSVLMLYSAFFFYLGVIIEAVEFSVLNAVLVLFKLSLVIQFAITGSAKLTRADNIIISQVNVCGTKNSCLFTTAHAFFILSVFIDTFQFSFINQNTAHCNFFFHK